MPTSGRRGPAETPLDEIVERLDKAELIEVVRLAAERHGDVERAVRLVAGRNAGDLAALRAEVDRGLRTRRFLDYREGIAWAQAARPLVVELDAVGGSAPSRDLVELVQRAIGHVVKVMLHADDSSGSIGDVAVELLRIHAKVCDAGVADPEKLARWMVRFRFRDQDFLEVDPVRYADALGERGLRAYRRAVAETDSPNTFAARYARERLAILDGDIDLLVGLLGGDLTRPHHFQRVAEAMVELDRPHLALEWARRGIDETAGWQIAQLYDLACELHLRLGDPDEALRLRRAHHERTPSGSTYTALRTAAERSDEWPVERAAARTVLRTADVRAYVSVLLDDADNDLAWETATEAAGDEIGLKLWLRLAERREPTHPADALAAYERVVDEILLETDRAAYQQAARVLKKARAAAHSAGQTQRFTDTIARLRETHRRRPAFLDTLERAGLTDT